MPFHVFRSQVDAQRRVTFYELPRVMIFQLKYFVYTEKGMEKLFKPIEYHMDLFLKNGKHTFLFIQS
jgi:hypothetical protein